MDFLVCRIRWREGRMTRGRFFLPPGKLAPCDSEEDTRAHHPGLDTASATRAATDGSFDSHALVQ